MKKITIFNNRLKAGIGVLVTSVIGIALPAVAHAEERPVFELGLGLGVISQNYYPGTKDTRTFAFPAIIPVYRGETLKSDEEGVRAELKKNSRFRLDLSLEFNLGVNSEDVTLREGMPDINNLLQIGPSLQYAFARYDDTRWLVRLPFRAVVGFGEETEAAGFTFGPDVTYLREMQFLGDPWRLGLSLGPQFGSSEYHDQYYGVNGEFATATRPAYAADGGLSAYRFLLTFTSKTPRRITSWFFRAENLSGSVVEDSPLVETDSSFTVGVIYSFLVYKSKRYVDR